MLTIYLLPVMMTAVALVADDSSTPATSTPFANYAIDFDTPTDTDLQKKLAEVDASVRERFGMTAEHTAVGLLDLSGPPRLAMLNPDRETYAASVPKVGILLAYFALKPEAETAKLEPQVRRELGEMIKISSNEMAAKYSRELGLKQIQGVLDRYKFYDKAHGGGIWVGKHYGKDAERRPSPVGDNSHAATVRQLLRFYLLLEQGKLVSPAASKVMRELFESPDIKHQDVKFVKGLAGQAGARVIRKSGSWENWLHDTAVVTGGGRHYILVALTEHPKGDAYLEALAPAVDDALTAR